MTTHTQAGPSGASGLNEPRVNAVLRRLHNEARHDLWLLPRLIPVLLLARLRKVPPMTATKPLVGKAYLAITSKVGNLLYLTARAIDARHAVEFGTSFGISSIYLAAAMRANGGRFVGSEIEANKVAVARRNLDEAGLSAVSEVREGDAMQMLGDLAAPIDFVFLDGWKDLYLPVLELLKPKLRKGSVVVADNILSPPMFRKTLKHYVDYMHNPANGFVSTTLPLGAGIEYSVFEGDGSERLGADERT
jgi:predicted O-methyltransferase YrrM